MDVNLHRLFSWTKFGGFDKREQGLKVQVFMLDVEQKRRVNNCSYLSL